MNISLGNNDLDQAASETMRHAMVASQLRTNAVSDQRILVAMNTVPREAFVPADVRGLAYRDTALPVAGGRAINLPMVTGRLLTEAYLERGDRVLLIGAAGGYTAAILAQIVADVVAVEEDAALAALAREALAGMANVRVVEGPLAEGAADGGPYDVLIVDGAVQHVPDRLVGQVETGGRVVTGLVEHGVIRLASGRRTDGGFGLAPFMDSDCVVLPGFAAPQGFRF
ncbi:protein-L-isoaspartate(D-aspartate) O-methyltransferase [Sphingomonas insulae]|uniref:Protein-L-isoaspartate O-methyltransferase n=1 Tax=Sphingomonas insulae TaxID=424800 RepID=A0ABN1HR70_9SPHN|nr:rRNA adenine N-6-methyltransferase family protein [Sphingomonas insulae]NIJ29224.1 protein-L-isoaspartate(D-aspartate) O-methyltransferase [Sphingomonas insulae]